MSALGVIKEANACGVRVSLNGATAWRSKPAPSVAAAKAARRTPVYTGSWYTRMHRPTEIGRWRDRRRRPARQRSAGNGRPVRPKMGAAKIKTRHYGSKPASTQS